ncbi:PREDICTED: uncharacterized protein LOC106928381 [Poecilia mexicana]|uniref:uncharacterized protein LOC106928381 n=1 Tax=Poecilia mexicana TaxID=48701 RepID=UPI00072E6EEF|nr:PREDICTED: uncharacterized protein LOC106928381 [Poecilia mexicana]
MNRSINSDDRLVPVIPMDMIVPMIEEFFWSISLDQTLDLAVGKPDSETKSGLKELLLDLAEECSTFILHNIRNGRIRSQDVDTVVGDVLLTTFADILQIREKVHPKTFDLFNEPFIKYVKEKVRSTICYTQDQAAAFVLQISETDGVDRILPHALRLIEELLVWSCKEHRQRERKAAEAQHNAYNKQQRVAVISEADHFQAVEKNTIKTPQNRGTQRDRVLHAVHDGNYTHFKVNLLPVIVETPDTEEATKMIEERDPVPENQDSDLKIVDEFILEDLSKITKEKESDLKIVDDFISEELSEVREVKKAISEQQRLEIPGVSLDALQPMENCGSRYHVAPLPFEQHKNKDAGVAVKKFCKKYSEGRYKRVAPAQKHEEIPGPSVDDFIPDKSNLSTGLRFVNEEQQPEMTTEVVEALSLGSGKEKHESSILLLANAVVMQAVTQSQVDCNYKDFQAITNRLSEKIYAELMGQELNNIQRSLNKLSDDILRGVSKRMCCAKTDVLSLLVLNDSVVDEAFISICKEKILKPAKKLGVFKRFWASVEKALFSL